MIVASRLEWGSGKTCRGVPSASARTTSSATEDGAAASALDWERVCRDDGGAVRDFGPLVGRAVRARGFGAELVVHCCRRARLSLSASQSFL